MQFTFDHNNINVLDLDRSIAFYRDNLGFAEKRRKKAADGSFELVFLTDGHTGHGLELTWLADRSEPYNLGDNESHLAVRVDDFEAAMALHRKNNVICYENQAMGLYFIEDPDGYWIEILPRR